MNRSAVLALSVVAALTAPPIAAQEAETDTLPRYEIPAVTVTATRRPVDRRIVPQSVDVVTSAEIEASGAGEVAELLRATTAIDAITFPGLLSGVAVRGFRPQYSGLTPRTLVLLDGRPLGTNNLSLVDVGAIERVEVLRGPGSALYGSSAMGGVVNVIPRRSTGDVAGTASLSYGGFGRYEGRGRAGGSLGTTFDFDVALAAIGQHDGYRIGSNRTFGTEELTKSLADGSSVTVPWVSPDSSITFTEYASRTGSARVGYRISNHWRLDLRGEGYAADGVENPGDLTPQDWDTRSLKDVGRGSAELQLQGEVGITSPRLRVYATREAVKYYNAPVSPNFVNFRTPTDGWGIQAQSAFELGGGSVTAGADYASATAASEAFSADAVPGAPYSPDSSVRSAALFGQALWSLLDSRLAISAGARLDRVELEILETPNLTGYLPDSESHTVFTPNAGARITIGSGVQAYGNVGQAFVTPEASRIAGYSESGAGIDRDAVFVTRGNPELRPESSVTWDAGLSLFRPKSGVEVDVAYFRTAVSDRITTSFSAPQGVELTVGGDTVLSTTTYINADEATINGLEGRLNLDVGGMMGWSRHARLFANGTRILRAEERLMDSDTETRIRNVADLTLVAGLEAEPIDRVTTRLAGRYVGERVDSDYVDYLSPGEILYPAYLVFDLSTRARITSRYTLGIELHNLTDEDYFEVRGYNQPGRWVAVTVEGRL